MCLYHYEFLGLTPKVQLTIDRLDFIEMNNLVHEQALSRSRKMSCRVAESLHGLSGIRGTPVIGSRGQPRLNTGQGLSNLWSLRTGLSNCDEMCFLLPGNHNLKMGNFNRENTEITCIPQQINR